MGWIWGHVPWWFYCYQRLCSRFPYGLGPEQIAQWPVMFRGESGSLFGNGSKIKYQDFLRSLKQVCQSLGYNETMFGSHSLRRGSVTDQFRLAVEITGVWTLYWSRDDLILSYPGHLSSGGNEIKNLRIIGVVGNIGKLCVKTTRQAQHANRSTK